MRRLLVILFALFSSYNWAQVNLVPNNSFEQIYSCPLSTCLYDTTIVEWFQPTNGTSDVFNFCAEIPSGKSVPSNFFGFQYAQDGGGYSGIFIYVPGFPNYREYIAIKLSDTLKFAVNYCIKFHVSLAEQYPKNISSIGIYFSSDSIHQNNDKVLQVLPQFENFHENFINDTTAWLLIKGNYLANGGEKYIYIGNFRNDSNTVVNNTSPGSRTYVYIDNVQVYECDSLIGIEENPFEKTKIYPNPAQDFINIELPKNYNQAHLSIYNLTGQLISQKQLTQPKQQISITEFNNGMYIFVIQCEDKVIGRQRVVVAR